MYKKMVVVLLPPVPSIVTSSQFTLLASLVVTEKERKMKLKKIIYIYLYKGER